MRADQDRLDAAAALWTEIERHEGAASAWRSLISTMLRDPEFIGY